ncbi:MAG: hypothetical protein Satyrvirus16_9 [Satyrvirus sp.]|uniref:Spore protein YkvP/CgeB glycosyl transferase-like domain-containing protein n=1 Tax=Satyrvirus sp. TaxID=2487771 RepID=A0A3G5AI18_9VIRU|nr:MAG: hypothetical protein Satyrvirus16_9 [Satyrvirus sp.]
MEHENGIVNVIIFENRKGIWTAYVSLMKIFKYLVGTKKYYQIDITEIVNKTENEVSKIFIEKFGKNPDNIILFLNKITKLDGLNIPISAKINVIVDDLHQKDEDKINKIIEFRRCSRIFSTYAYVFHKFYSKDDIGGIPVYNFPHCVNYVSNFNTNPLEKILVSGRLNPLIYPFRQKMVEISKNKEENEDVDYLPVDHGYRISEDKSEYIYGDRYIDYLNKYLVCFTCDSRKETPYIVKKFIEIPASGALLLGGNTETKSYFVELGFVDGIHYISASMENIGEKIKYVLDPKHRPEIDNIRRNGYELVKSRHLHTHRANLLDDVLNKKLII